MGRADSNSVADGARHYRCRHAFLQVRATTLIKEGGGMLGTENFDLSNEFNILRIICGAFFIPHVYAKIFVPEALGFFVAARFKPPKIWMYAALAMETVLAICLIFGIYTSHAAWIAAVHLGIAGAAVYRVTGGKWLWNIGGIEYCLFWAISCIVVAMHG